MSNAPVIREVIKPAREIISGKPPAQQTATARKQAQTAAKEVAGERREAVAAAAERSAAARARRGSRGMRSLLSPDRSGMVGGLARRLGGL
jgi:phage protein D